MQQTVAVDDGLCWQDHMEGIVISHQESGDTHLLSAELLESEPGLLHWPVHTLDQCHQQDVPNPTALPGPAKAAAIGAPAPGWQMKSKSSHSSLPVLLYD